MQKLRDKCFNNFLGEVEGGRGKRIKQNRGVVFWYWFEQTNIWNYWGNLKPYWIFKDIDELLLVSKCGSGTVLVIPLIFTDEQWTINKTVWWELLQIAQLERNMRKPMSKGSSELMTTQAGCWRWGLTNPSGIYMFWNFLMQYCFLPQHRVKKMKKPTLTKCQCGSRGTGFASHQGNEEETHRDH